VENLTRKLSGKPTQPVVSPQDAQAARVAPLAARGKTPAQQQTEAAQQAAQQGATFDRSQIAPDMQAKVTAIQDTLTKAGVDPKVIQDAVAAAVGVPYRRPSTDELKRQDYQSMLMSGQAPKDKQGNPLSYEAWSAQQAASGRADGAPAPRPSMTPRVGTSGGKNTYALLTPDGWVDAGSKQPLKDFKPLPTYAQIAPSMRGVQVVSDTDPTKTEYDSITDAIKNHRQGTQSIDYKLQMPTGQERGRGQLAGSAIEQMDDLRSLLKKRSDIFGPAAGRATRITQWLGTQDPDAQRAQAAITTIGDHLQGVYGGRSTAAGKQIQSAIGLFNTNPEASIAALDQFEKAAKNIQASGAGPAPKKAAGSKPVVQHSASTNQYRYSMDGGKTWQPGQPPSQ
jgi:hypothetical protein